MGVTTSSVGGDSPCERRFLGEGGREYVYIRERREGNRLDYLDAATSVERWSSLVNIWCCDGICLLLFLSVRRDVWEIDINVRGQPTIYIKSGRLTHSTFPSYLPIKSHLRGVGEVKDVEIRREQVILLPEPLPTPMLRPTPTKRQTHFRCTRHEKTRKDNSGKDSSMVKKHAQVIIKVIQNAPTLAF